MRAARSRAGTHPRAPPRGRTRARGWRATSLEPAEERLHRGIAGVLEQVATLVEVDAFERLGEQLARLRLAAVEVHLRDAVVRLVIDHRRHLERQAVVAVVAHGRARAAVRL